MDIPQGYHNVIFVALYGWNSKLTYWRCNTDKVKSTRNLMGVSRAIKLVLTCNTIPIINYIRVVSFSITKGGSGNKQGSASGRPGLFAGR